MSTAKKFQQRQLRKLTTDNSPPWWRLAQVAIVPVVGVAVLWSLFSGPDEQQPDPAATGVPYQLTAPGDPTTAAPDDDTTPADQGGVEATVPLPQVIGYDEYKTPRSAYDAVIAAMKAYQDPSTASQVPTADGSKFPTPAKAYPKAAVNDVRVYEGSPSSITFAVRFDPDGKGPGSAMNVDVLAMPRDDGSWGVVPPGLD